WAGIRPLIAKGRGTPSDTSRRHEIKQSASGWWDVTGGKLTTYRLMGEEVVDQLVRTLGRKATRCRTADEPLLPANEVSFSGIISPFPSQQAVQHYCQNEWAVHLEDVMLRRTSWRHGQEHGEAVSEQVAHWMGSFLSWDDAVLYSELDNYRRILHDHDALMHSIA
ncbi:MAG: glycerol-3-phosphate dehydrogenase C-terminal domain-containing protein, partial [Aeoliella sp.]